MNSPPPLYDRATYSPISRVVVVKVSAPERIGWMSYVCPFKSSIFPWNCSWPLFQLRLRCPCGWPPFRLRPPLRPDVVSGVRGVDSPP